MGITGKKDSTSESLVFVGMTGNGDLVAVRIWEFQCKSAKKGGTDQIVSRRLKQVRAHLFSVPTTT